LTVWVVELSERLWVRWSYNTDLFDESRIERMHSHYEMLLHSIVADPEERLNSLNILTAAEQSQQAAEQDVQEEASLMTLTNARRRSQVTWSVP
jgi:non-ribosomal peptide synthetase component F